MVLAALATAELADQSSVDREIPAACDHVLERARQYFSGHGFWNFPAEGSGLGEPRTKVVLKLGSGKQPLITPSGQRVWLNRFGVQRYLEKGQMSLFRVYTEFELRGTLELTSLKPDACRAALQFEVGAYEWSPIWIVDGWAVTLKSNGTLERQYLEAIFGNNLPN
jgi:hypothetical protein